MLGIFFAGYIFPKGASKLSLWAIADTLGIRLCQRSGNLLLFDYPLHLSSIGDLKTGFTPGQISSGMGAVFVRHQHIFPRNHNIEGHCMIQVEVELKRIQTFLFQVPRLKAMLGANALVGEVMRVKLNALVGEVMRVKLAEKARPWHVGSKEILASNLIQTIH